MIKINGLTLFVILALSLAALTSVYRAQAPAPNISLQAIAESGTFSNGVYENKALGFSLTLPPGWIILSDDLNKEALKTGKELIKKGTSGAQSDDIDKSIAKSRVLFQSQPESAASTNDVALLACGLERLSVASSAASYSASNKTIVLKTIQNARLTKDLYETALGGQRFTAFELEADANGLRYRQTYLVTLRRGFAFFFVTSYASDSGGEKMSRSLSTLKFIGSN